MSKKNGIMNADRLLKKLDKMQKMKLKNGIAKAADFVQGEAKKLVPKDTSTLMNSIFYSVKETNYGVEGVVYTNNEYAVFVEFGTGPTGQANHQGIDPDVHPRYSPTGWTYFDEKKQEWIHTKGQKAQPFMYPAFHNNREKVKGFIVKELKQILEEVKK